MADDKGNTVTIQVGDSSDENRQGGAGVEVMDLGGGDDTANTGGGFMNVNLGGSGADDLTSQGILDFVLGGSGDDTITATGYFAILRGGSGDDTIYGADRADSVEWLYGDEGADTIYGRAGTDFIYGGDGADTIYGGSGDDHIVGGAGDDDLTGGTGADTFYFWEGHGTDTIKDFNATDGDKINLIVFDQTITWDDLSTKITTVTDENNVVTGVQIDLSDWGGGTVILDGITSVSDLTEDMFVLNRIVGADDTDDDLVGGDSDDTMTGGTGADTFYFLESSGDDTITDFSTTEGDKIDLTAFSVSITWEQLQAAMSAVEDDASTTDVDESGTKIDLSAYGGGTITLRGVSSSDLTADMFVLHDLSGEDDSDDTIVGGTSDDTMSGGTGADTFFFYEGHGADTITDFSTAEGDVIDLTGLGGTITWAELQTAMTAVEDDTSTTEVDETATVIDLSAWGGGSVTLEGVTSTDLTEDMFNLPDGSTIQFVVGNSDDNTYAGTRDADRIFGAEGDDTIGGGAGDDELYGGEGADTLTGGEGDDLLMGGEGADTLTGGAGDDMLVGGEGDDTLTGGDDADTFVFGEDGGDDTITDFDTTQDKIHLTSFSATVAWDDLSTKITTVTDENNVVTGVQIDLSDYGGGTITLDGITSVSDLTAEHFVLDQIVGSDDSDDTLEGGTSDDTMTGGTGSDTFVFRESSGNDTITDFSTAADTIDLTAFDSSITWAQLSGKITAIDDDPDTTDVDESGTKIDLSDFGGGTITLNGVTSSDLTADNFILDDFAGTDGDDTIEGGTTDDTLTGGTGADTFVFNQDSGDDSVTDFTPGTDKVDLSAFTGITGASDLTLYQVGSDFVIDLSAHGGGSVTLEGVSSSELSVSDFVFYQNTYTGTAAAETLTGGEGDDTITGLGGDDTLTGNAGADTFVFASGHGADTITDFTDGDDTIDLSAFTGITAFTDLDGKITQSGDDTVIDLSAFGGGTITLEGYTSTDLSADDFAF